MKKIFKTLLIGGVALNMMTSCSDFLDQRSPSELTEETVFNSIYYANNVLNKVYGSLTNDQTYSQYFAFVWILIIVHITTLTGSVACIGTETVY